MNDGFIEIPNSLLDSDVWNKHEKYSKLDAFVYLVKESRRQKRNIKVKDISCGQNQLVRSYSELMSAWKLPNKNDVKRYLDFLQKGGWIGLQKFKNATLITIQKGGACNANVTANVTDNHNENQAVAGSVVTADVTQMQRPDSSSHTQVILNLFDDDYISEQDSVDVESPLNPPKGKPKGYENFDFSFVDEKFYDVFVQWLDYKREGCNKKFVYKSQSSLRTCYDGIIKTSKGIPEAAMDILTHSITSGYQGYFAPSGFWLEWEKNHGQVEAKVEEEEHRPKVLVINGVTYR